MLMNTNIDVTGIVLETSRLILRPWKMEDLADFYEYAKDPKTGPMAGWTPHQSEQESLGILQRFVEGKKTFAIVYKENNKVIGSLGIEKYDEERMPKLKDLRCRELGFVLSRDYWGRKLMPEAVKKVIERLFMEIGLDAIMCGHYTFNSQSARVQEKCGFKFYSASTHYSLSEDKEIPTVENIIYFKDWVRDNVIFESKELDEDTIDQLIELSRIWEKEDITNGYRENTVEDLKTPLITASINGKIIGYAFGHFFKQEKKISYAKIGDDCFDIDEIYVLPRYRNLGIGERILKEIENMVKDKCDFITLGTSTKDYEKILDFYIKKSGMTFHSAHLYKKI
jgi:ribosomal-protein-alanine N-acetyltransferase